MLRYPLFAACILSAGTPACAPRHATPPPVLLTSAVAIGPPSTVAADADTHPALYRTLDHAIEAIAAIVAPPLQLPVAASWILSEAAAAGVFGHTNAALAHRAHYSHTSAAVPPRDHDAPNSPAPLPR